MKKLILLLILFAVSTQNFAQEFAPIGAIWHYTQGTINPNLISFKTIESISDTIINGTHCKKLCEVERYLDTINVDYHYMYLNNDSVFFFADNDFHLLYDFGAVAGDTIILDYFSTHNGTPLRMIIDSTNTISENGQDRKIQYITCGDGVVIEFGHHVIEGIGNTYFMFPTFDGTINGPLRCYQDDSTSLFLSPFHPNSGWNHQDCEEIITEIEEINSIDNISIYPNPSKDKLIIYISEPISIVRVIDLNGRRQNVEFEYPNLLNISSLKNGLYLMIINNKQVLKFIKK